MDDKTEWLQKRCVEYRSNENDINESIEDTFTSLVLADVLVISKSSYSYIAGILSEGIVYYQPFWHSPLPNWKVAPAIEIIE